jgi:CheY-like chemotaxis protein
MRELLSEYLQASGYTVLAAANGVGALHIAGQHQGAIDMLITDVIMPQMSGPELARSLAPRRPSLKVLYMSSYADDKLRQTAVSDRDVALLQKPFQLVDLAQKLREILGRSPDAPPVNSL